MSTSPLTRSSLLIRIRDQQDTDAWGDFVEIYVPLIHRFGLSRGLQYADASDLAQEVVASIADSIGLFEYERDRGSFRSWLFTVTLNRLRRMATQKNRQPIGSGDTGVQQSLGQLAASDDEAEWNRELRQRLFHWAAEQVKDDVKPTTWQAFWQTAVLNQSPADVARDLEMSVGTVYVAKNRMIAKIRDKVSQTEPDIDAFEL